jgi:2-succinyl-5-enolpyruvyl-6-hydroxy-3-cyclohexene-1-carboxylate synthase
MIEALARAESAGLVRIWRHFEERSAGFFALGRTIETGKPCAVVTTSGTAGSGVAARGGGGLLSGAAAGRADGRSTGRIPWNSGAPQAIEQPGIFGVYAIRLRGELAEWDGKMAAPSQCGVRRGAFEPGS